MVFQCDVQTLEIKAMLLNILFNLYLPQMSLRITTINITIKNESKPLNIYNYISIYQSILF